MMKRYLISIFLLAVLLVTGCTAGDAVKEENESVKQEQTTPKVEQSEKVNELLPMRSPEGLSLEDKRVGINPTKLEIPSLKVDAPIEDVGRLENGQMGVPQDPDNIGWFEPGILPGAQGNAVMAGHIDSLTGPAVFHNLAKLKQGDEVVVHGEEGEVIRFIVTKTESYPRNDAPVEEIFGFNYSSGLTLITCIGEFNRDAQTHEERFVVYTELKDE